MRNSSGHEKNVRPPQRWDFQSQAGVQPGGMARSADRGNTPQSPRQKGASGPRSREQAGKVLDRGQSRML